MRKILLTIVGAASLIQTAEALPFTFLNADLCLGLRKTGANQENYEVVVNLGQASNFVAQAVGTTITISNSTGSQLVPSCFANFNNLSWSVVGAQSPIRYTGYPNNTCWVTVPRTTPSVQSTPPYRPSGGFLQQCRVQIFSIFQNASTVSGGHASNDVNTPYFVRESIADDPTHLLSLFMGGVIDNTKGTLKDTWPPDEPNDGNVETTTPAVFDSAMRCDLYEVRPDGSLDPNTGSTTGNAYLLGYFELAVDGTMTFTRVASSVTPPPPPPPPVLTISRSGGISTVSFLSTNAATYTLYFTNAGGLTAPIATWPSNTTTVLGDGSTKQFFDTTSDANRYYRVGAQN